MEKRIGQVSLNKSTLQFLGGGQQPIRWLENQVEIKKKREQKKILSLQCFHHGVFMAKHKQVADNASHCINEQKDTARAKDK